MPSRVAVRFKVRRRDTVGNALEVKAIHEPVEQAWRAIPAEGLLEVEVGRSVVSRRIGKVRIGAGRTNWVDQVDGIEEGTF